MLVDLLAKPHQEQAACRERNDACEIEVEHTRSGIQVLRLHEIRTHEVLQPHVSLHDAETNGCVTRPLHNLLLAARAFLAEFLERRKHGRQ